MAVGRLPDELLGRWNHNTHYYPLALDATPCRRALDVGCGDGMLLRMLAARCEQVVGVDPWTDESICGDLPNVRVIAEDFLSVDLEPASFDLVHSNTAIHHMDFGATLTKMATLVRPGGRLVVVGIADHRNRLEWAAAGGGIVPHRLRTWRHGFYNHAAPIAGPTMTYAAVRATAQRILPDAQYKRRLYWRYSLVWNRPG